MRHYRLILSFLLIGGCTLLLAAFLGGKLFSQGVERYILNHPEVLVRSLEGMKRAQQDEKAKSTSSLVQEYHKALYENQRDGALGTGSRKIVVFIDVNCGYCRHSFSDLLTLSQNNKDLKIIFKEFPILRPSSVLGAQALLVAQKHQKYPELLTLLMQEKGELQEEALLKHIETLGMEKASFQKEMQSPDILNHLEDTARLAQRLTIEGTPAFIIKDKLFPYALEAQALSAEIEHLK